jgi:cell wall-associated NlpC family hydrolase
VHEFSSSRRLSANASKIALTLGLCLCAGQLVATPASAAPASSATSVLTALAATTTPRVGIAANTRTIGWGSAVKLTAKLTDPRTGKAVKGGYVRLQAYHRGAWRTQQMKKVPASGVVSFSARPTAYTAFRMKFDGVAGFRSAASGMIKVKVQRSGAKILAEAKRHKGARYVFGASGPRVFDCSGFTGYVYKKAVGKKLPHKANLQQKYGTAVTRSKAQVGDLIVFRSGSYGTHAGVYAGGGYMWDAPHTGAVVGKHKIYGKSYVVRRLV